MPDAYLLNVERRANCSFGVSSRIIQSAPCNVINYPIQVCVLQQFFLRANISFITLVNNSGQFTLLTCFVFLLLYSKTD